MCNSFPPLQKLKHHRRAQELGNTVKILCTINATVLTVRVLSTWSFHIQGKRQILRPLSWPRNKAIQSTKQNFFCFYTTPSLSGQHLSKYTGGETSHFQIYKVIVWLCVLTLHIRQGPSALQK